MKKLIFLLALTFSHPVYAETASFYHDKFTGRTTANGEVYSPSKMTAAHKTLPFGTKVKVTNKKTGKSVIVRINDRGPVNRTIDLSRGAAKALGIIKQGVARVTLEILK